MSAPKPGQWVAICYGPGEQAVLGEVVPKCGQAPGVYLKRSPFRVMPSAIMFTSSDRDAVQAYCAGVNAANARHIRGMERARLAANEAWNADVSRLLI